MFEDCVLRSSCCAQHYQEDLRRIRRCICSAGWNSCSSIDSFCEVNLCKPELQRIFYDLERQWPTLIHDDSLIQPDTDSTNSVYVVNRKIILVIHATSMPQRWYAQAPYPSSISRIPSSVGAARGSKITLKLPGRETDESVMSFSSIGEVGSGLTVRAHRISAVSRNTDLLINNKQLLV